MTDKASIDHYVKYAENCVLEADRASHGVSAEAVALVTALKAIAYSLLAIRLELASIADNTTPDEDGDEYTLVPE